MDAEATVVMTDVRGSTRALVGYAARLDEFVQGPWQRYLTLLLQIVEQSETGIVQQAELTGDGLALVVGNPTAALGLASKLQEACDGFAEEFQADGQWALDGFTFATGVGLATDRVVRLAPAGDQTRLGERFGARITGMAFNRAARVTAKSCKAATLSPLCDERTKAVAPTDGPWQFCRVGQFVIDSKAEDQPQLVRPTRLNDIHEPLYSFVPAASPCADLARTLHTLTDAHRTGRLHSALNELAVIGDSTRSKPAWMSGPAWARWRRLVERLTDSA